jgi:uncharacterized protein
MVRALLVLSVCLFVLSGCSNSDDDTSPYRAAGKNCETPIDHPDPPDWSPGRVLIDTNEGSVLFDAEVADHDDQRAFGLMFRDSFPRDCAMVFLYFEEHTGTYWMKDVRIPLSVAFFDTEGTILAIFDMEPCLEEEDANCPGYGPETPYVGAVEVNQGVFEEEGVAVGDRITVNR